MLRCFSDALMQTPVVRLVAAKLTSKVTSNSYLRAINS